MMWCAHISVSTPSYPLLTYIQPASSLVLCRYSSYIIHVVHVSVFAYTYCLVWWLISTIPIYIVYSLSCIVVIDIERCVVHRCIVWCVVVPSSWRWVFYFLFCCYCLRYFFCALVSFSPLFFLSSSALFLSFTFSRYFTLLSRHFIYLYSYVLVSWNSCRMPISSSSYFFSFSFIPTISSQIACMLWINLQ